MLIPCAAFWRLWARACVVIALVCVAALNAPVHAATMRTSFYGAESGRFNADGSRFAPMGLTAAHRSLPFGTRLKVCLAGCAIVTVRDRGPAAWTGRALDLSHGAARAIGLEGAGVATVDVTIVGRDERLGARPSARHRRTRRHHHR